MSDSKSGSKDNLNESEAPLLADDGAEKAAEGETPEKEVEEVEMEEKKDEATEKAAEAPKKEKKVKVPKVPKPKGPSCIETNSAGLDLANRDSAGINCEIDVSDKSCIPSLQKVAE